MARRTGRLAAVAALATAAAMVPAGAQAGSSGRAAPAGHPARAVAEAGVISTLAGGVGGPGAARQVALPGPCGLALAAGNLYVSEEGSVRKVSSTGFLTTPAGTGGIIGPLGDGGPAVRATVGLCGIAVDHSGNLVIADGETGRIRVVAARTGTFYGQAMTVQHIYTVAGGGTDPGDGVPATAAALGAWGVRVDGVGNLVIAEMFGNRIRVVAATTGTFYGQAMIAQHIYTVAGNGTSGFAGDGGPATSAELFSPAGVALDAVGNVVIADTSNNRVRVVAARTGTFYGRAMTAGDIYTVAGGGSAFPGDGGPATNARLDTPSDTALDHAGNLLIADTLTNRIRVVAVSTGTFYGQAMTAGDIYTVAGRGGRGFNGDGGPATAAQLHWPRAVKVDSAGNLLIGDTDNFRVRVVASTTGTFYGKPMTAGNIYTVAGNGTPRDSGDHGLAIRAQIDAPRAVAEDGVGNVMIADSDSNRVRVVAAKTGTFYGQAMTAGDIYTAAGTGKFGFSGDGGPATKAKLDFTFGVSVDGPGNVVISDSGNDRVRVAAARAGTFYGRAMTAGDIYTVAGGGTAQPGDGGPATAAALSFPEGAGADQAGNLLIAESGRDRIRVVAGSTGTFYGQAMTAGHIYTVAGVGFGGFSGDGGPAIQATLDTPYSVTVDHAGNMVISDTSNNRVRVVAVKTGTFYGQAMTAGDIYTVAGGGGNRTEGGVATNSLVGAPGQVAVDGTGNLVIAATGNQRIMVVAVKTGTFYGKAMAAGHIYTVAGVRTFGLFGDGGPATTAGLQPGGRGAEQDRRPGDRRHQQPPDPQGQRLTPPGTARGANARRSEYRATAWSMADRACPQTAPRHLTDPHTTPECGGVPTTTNYVRCLSG